MRIWADGAPDGPARPHAQGGKHTAMAFILATSQTVTTYDGRVHDIGESTTLLVTRDVTVAATGDDGVAIETVGNCRIQADGTVVAGGPGGIRQDLASTLGLHYISVGATGTVTGDNGIVLFSDNNNIANAGEIRGLIGTGVQISQGSNSLVNTGSIYGASAGVFLGDSNNSVDNSGLIFSGSTGLSYGIAVSGSNNRINNSGQIVVTTPGNNAADTAEAVRFFAGGNFLTNSGAIRSSGLAIKATDGLAGTANLIVNTGVIETTGGSTAIRLSGSNDTLVNGGRIAGNFDGAAGSLTSGVVLGGDGNDTLVGGAMRDVLVGDAGADSLEGGAGDDALRPGLGFDVIDGGDGLRDLLDYLGATAVKVNLATGDASGGALGDIFGGIECLAGSSANDVLTGDGLANTLTGRAGNDLLTGGAGNDHLVGDAGADTLIGGAGVDTLRGGLDADIFRFLAASDSGAPGQLRDRIVDFTKVQGDRIDLSAIDANAGLAGNQAFVFRGSQAFSGAGEVRAQVIDGNTYVSGNTDANTSTVEFSIVLLGTVTLGATDFIL